MKTQTFLLVVAITIAFIIWLDADLTAQCAMCRANVKSNLNGGSGGGVGQTLNHAILYLMAIPYLLITMVGYVFFKEKVDSWVLGKVQLLKNYIGKKSQAA